MVTSAPGSQKILRLGIVGAGSIGELHAKTAARLGTRFSVTAVADPKSLAAGSLAGKYDAAAFSDHLALAESGLVDAVVVASPNSEHRQQTCDLLERGIAVLLEKPMAETVTECDAMIATMQRTGVVLVVGHVQRYLPSVRRAGELVRAGAIGAPNFAATHRAARYEAGSRPSWFLDPRVAGGGILTNLGTHCVDRLLSICDQKITGVRGAWSTGRLVATDVAALLDHDNGLASSLRLTGTGLPDIDVTDVIGDERTLRISSTEGVQVYHRGDLVFDLPPDPRESAIAFTMQLIDFHEAVAAHKPVAVDAYYARAIVQNLHMIQTAAASSQPHRQELTHD